MQHFHDLNPRSQQNHQLEFKIESFQSPKLDVHISLPSETL